MSLRVPATVAGGATGTLRNKTALRPGHSLMDWIRLGKGGKDLSGVKGQRLQVTTEQLAQHNTQEDGWIAIREYVYNVTPYMDFHPGGVPELVRGLGKDATFLFDEVHRWVNFESMLAPCLVGRLADNKKTSVTPKRVGLKEQAAMAPPQLTISAPKPPPQESPSTDTPAKPRYDWFQSDDNVSVVIYTGLSSMRHDNVIIDQPGPRELRLTLLISEHTYTIHMELEDHLLMEYAVKVSLPSGKTEVVFQKQTKKQSWKTLGSPLKDHDSWLRSKDLSLVYRPCKLISVDSVTHDTQLFCFEVPRGTRLCVPLGHHVHLRADVEGVEVSRSYTAVPFDLGSQFNESELQKGLFIYLMIKIYPDGALSQVLGNMCLGDSMDISNPEGIFTLQHLEGVRSLVLCAAGTGFTPMAGLLQHLLSHQEMKVHLLFFNKKEQDILWRNQLSQISKLHGHVSVQHVLSQPVSDWIGLTGRINKTLLQDLLNNHSNEDVLFCACGPTTFTELAVQLAEEMGLSRNRIHAFVG